jgi:Tol biopolymer transport system component
MVSTRGHPDEQNLAWLDNTEFFRFSVDGSQILMGDESSASGTHHASFLRNVDGSSAVRVGEGDGIALSPDGEWVLSRIPPDELVLLPTGAGEVRRLTLSGAGTDSAGKQTPRTAIRADLPGDWLPDGKHIAYVGDDSRTHLLDLEGKDVVLTATGTTGYLPTADGKFLLVRTAKGNFELYPVGSGDPAPFPYLEAGDKPIRFSSDGKDIFVRNSQKGVPGTNLYRVNLTSGTRSLLWHLQAPSSNLSNEVSLVDVTPDGTGYAYGYRQKSTVLYSVSGLK